jgi:hypothetical protein
MSSFRAKSLGVKATRILISPPSNQAEATRIGRELGLGRGRVHPGALLGWIAFTNLTSEAGEARHGHWIVLWPDGELSAMPDNQFRTLFEPAEE